ncbi:MAG: gluconokinase [Bacteroidota bacterium]
MQIEPAPKPASSTILMGVAGSGKTTIGRALAARLGQRFVDADDYHPPANVAKMEAGQPLTDADRWPWLHRLRDVLQAEPAGAVLACSALKGAYREVLRDGPEVRFVFLAVPQAEIERRLRTRSGHFMPASLAASQFATLEPPADALTLDGTQPVDVLVDQLVRAFS